MSHTIKKPQTDAHIHFKTAYGPKLRVALSFPENSRWTKQSFKDECDINNVMGRYLSNGEIPQINQTAPQYLDVTGYDYQSAMELVAGAQSLFEEVPSNIRNRFQNDPAQFLDFCSNEKNREEMAQMGLLSVPNQHPGLGPTPEPKKASTGRPEPLPETAPMKGENPLILPT